jgi:hypothetical protein
VREGAERRVRRERSKSGLFRHSASGRMRVSRARRGQARSGVCRVCPPPVRTPRPRRRGAPPQAREKKPRQRPHTPHTRTRGTRAGARVSREGTPTLQVTAQHHPQLPGPRRIEAESITSLWYPESLLMNWVVLRHSMTPMCGPLPLWSRLDAETPAHRHGAYPRPLPPAASRV